MLKFLSARRFNYIDLLANAFLASFITAWGMIGIFYAFPFFVILSLVSLKLKGRRYDATDSSVV